MISITVNTRTIDEDALRETFYGVGWPAGAGPYPHEERAPDIVDRGLNGRLQISDGERELFENEGAGPGETVNLLGVLFDSYRALELIPVDPGPYETGFWPDSSSLYFRRVGDDSMMVTGPGRGHWVVGTPVEWAAALNGAFDELRAWILRNAPYLQEDDVLNAWITGGPPPRRDGPFARG